MKRCGRCKVSKALDQFGPHKGMPDGLNNACRPCTREVSAASRAKARARDETRPALDPERTKRCPACNEVKPASTFGPSKTSKGGLTGYCRECFNDIHRARYAANPEKARQRVTQGRSTPEAKERDHKTRIAGYYRDHAASLAYHRRRYWADPDKARIKGRMDVAKRKAMKLANGVEDVDLNAIIKRDGLICHICKKPVEREKVSPDHLIPIAHGGPHAAWNIGVSHRLCNIRRNVGHRIPAQPHLDL